MTDDLVKRLVSLADCDARAGEPLGKCMREAADRIEELEANLAKVIEAYRIDAMQPAHGPSREEFYREIAKITGKKNDDYSI